MFRNAWFGDLVWANSGEIHLLHGSSMSTTAINHLGGKRQYRPARSTPPRRLLFDNCYLLTRLPDRVYRFLSHCHLVMWRLDSVLRQLRCDGLVLGRGSAKYHVCNQRHANRGPNLLFSGCMDWVVFHDQETESWCQVVRFCGGRRVLNPARLRSTYESTPSQR